MRNAMAIGVVAAVGLFGCGTPEPVREHVAALMPQPAAARIIQEMWPEYDGGPAIPWGNEYIMIRAVRELHHFPNNQLGRVPHGDCIANVSLDQARSFTEALRSMGGTVELVRHPNPALGRCTLVRR